MAKRPVFFIALAFCLGILLQQKLPLPEKILALGFILISACVFFISFRQRKNTPDLFVKRFSLRYNAIDCLLLAACLAAGMLRTHFAQRPTPNDISAFADAAAEVVLFGKVNDLPEPRNERWRFPFRVQRVKTATGWSNTSGVVIAFSDSLSDVAINEQLLLRGFLRLADESRNPGAFDYRAYLQAQGISAIFYCHDRTLLWREKSREAFSWRHVIAQTKAWINTQLNRFSQGQSLALLRGLLFGERDEISKEVIEAFQRTGLVHILAVSGSNVGFIALIVLVALSLLRVPKRWHPIFLLIGIGFYMFLTGAQPPVVRASIMAAVIILSRSFERDADIYNSLGVAALIILLWQPLQLLQLGFQLTFVAVIGIVYLYRPLALLFRRMFPSRWPSIR